MLYSLAPLNSSDFNRRAQIGEVALEELNALELDFLFAIDFDLGVRPADFSAAAADPRALVLGPAPAPRAAPSESRRPPRRGAQPWAEPTCATPAGLKL